MREVMRQTIITTDELYTLLDSDGIADDIAVELVDGTIADATAQTLLIPEGAWILTWPDGMIGGALRDASIQFYATRGEW